jgi:hypothetical protein
LPPRLRSIHRSFLFCRSLDFCDAGFDALAKYSPSADQAQHDVIMRQVRSVPKGDIRQATFTGRIERGFDFLGYQFIRPG